MASSSRSHALPFSIGTLLLLYFTFAFHTSPVSAHGYLNSINIDNKAFRGPFPSANASLGPNSPSIIRQVRDVGPVQGAANPDLNCGIGASNTAEQVADANPGSVLQFVWHGGDDQNWTHNVGPMMAYMTSCGSSSCTQFDPISAKAKWFKIHQVGRQPDGDRDWAQNFLTHGYPDNVTIPPMLAPGNYLIRHELLALHNGGSRGGAEFYVACAQLRVGGSQRGVPTNNELATFPGAYSDTDDGILDKNAYDPGKVYTFPGPPVAAFVNAGAASPTGTSGGGSVSSSATALHSCMSGWSQVWITMLFAFGVHSIQSAIS